MPSAVVLHFTATAPEGSQGVRVALLNSGPDLSSGPAAADKAFARRKPATFACLCLVSMIDYADKSALGGLFLPLQRAFGAAPNELAYLFLAQNVAVALFGPIWGWLADEQLCARHRLLGGACLLWGALTAASAAATQLWHLLVLRALTGGALAALLPLSQSMIADMAPEHHRGRAFGYVGGAAWGGAVVGSSFATIVGNQDSSPIPLLAGYSFVFLVIGLISMLLGGLTWAVAADPPRCSSHLAVEDDGEAVEPSGSTVHPPSGTPRSQAARCDASGLCRAVFSVRTFLLLTAQGLTNSIADRSISTFLTLWLQNVGFSDAAASILSSLCNAGCAFGALAGGRLGDVAAALLPASGRVLVAQSGLSCCIVAWLLIFYCFADPSDAVPLGIMSFVAGAVGAAYTPATNRPILSEVVPAGWRGAAFAWEYSVSTASGAIFGSLGPGYLATYFGYVAYTQRVSELTDEQRRGNAAALADAVAWISAPAWALCVVVYSFVVCTYPRDRDRIRDSALSGRSG